MRGELNYVGHPSFDDPTARDAILGPLPDSADDQAPRRLQPSEWLTPLAGRPLRTAILVSRAGGPPVPQDELPEVPRRPTHGTARSGLARPRRPRRDRAAPMRGAAVKNRIVEMNLRLVVSIAKMRVRPGYDLSECVSDGNFGLIKAVDAFDFARGYRFSTYATWAIRNVLVENERRFIRHRRHHFALNAESVAAADSDVDEPRARRGPEPAAIVGRTLAPSAR